MQRIILSGGTRSNQILDFILEKIGVYRNAVLFNAGSDNLDASFLNEKKVLSKKGIELIDHIGSGDPKLKTHHNNLIKNSEIMIIGGGDINKTVKEFNKLKQNTKNQTKIVYGESAGAMTFQLNQSDKLDGLIVRIP